MFQRLISFFWCIGNINTIQINTNFGCRRISQRYYLDSDKNVSVWIIFMNYITYVLEKSGRSWNII